MKLYQIVFGSEPVSEGPEAGLANSLSKGLGNNYFAMPGLCKPKAPTTDAEPIRKDGTPRKRRHRKYMRSQAEQPGI